MTSDIRRLLRGDGAFADDIHLPGMLHVAFVRSLHAHARLVALDAREALGVPGVAMVLRAADLGALNAPLPVRFQHPGLHHPQMPRPLADGVVRFVGEPVAAVVADGRYAAADAADLVRVDYDPLPAASSLDAARAEGAPLVHEDAAGNVAGSYHWRVGNTTAALAGAPVRLAFRLTISRGSAVPIETRGCVAAVDATTGRLGLWASTQSPHHLQHTVARLLDLPEDRVRVVAPDVGGAFGVKGGAPREYILVAYLALRTGRPVKWIEDRREHLVACQHDRDQTHYLELAATREGDLLGLRDLFWLDVGAYTLYGHLIGMHTVAHMVGPYRLPHLDVRLETVYTHRVPAGAYRGAGRPQGTYVIERAMDALARELELDPAAVRRRNLIPPEAMPHDTGLRQPGDQPVEYDSGDYPRVLQVALERFDYAGWRAEQRRRREAGVPALLGVGVALYVQETAGPGDETVTLRMDPSGRVQMTAGPPSQGQGLVPILTRVIGQELAIPPARVRVATGDTAAMAESNGTHGSRVATLIGNAAALAARKLASRLRALAAEVARCDPAEVELRDGRTVVRGRPGNGIGYGDLIKRLAGNDPGRGRPPAALEVSAIFASERSAWSSGAHLVALEVDTETGAVRILRYLIVHDSGAVLDEEAVRRQILGGVVQGIGGSLYERLAYDESGQPLVATLADYAVPRAAQVPPIEIVRIETPSPHNPLGLKGAGESGCMAVYPAIAAAVEDALAERGCRVSALPLPAAEIWAMLHRDHG